MLTTTISPSSVVDGETFTVEVAGLTPFIGSSAEIHLCGTDDIATMWVGSSGPTVDESGIVRASFNLNLGRETLLEISRLNVNTKDGQRTWDHPGSLPAARALLNGAMTAPSASDLERRRQELEELQRARYDLPLGDRTDTSHEFRVLCVVERLLLTTRLRLPGIHLVPLNVGGSGAGEAEQLNRLLSEVGWRAQVDPSWWSDRSRANRPWLALLMPTVWADDYDAAAELAWAARDRILHLLALNRIASGRPIATVLEGEGTERIYHEDDIYRGNLVGGSTSGEDQHGLLVQVSAVAADPLLALLTDLLRQAINEPNIDAAYFRYWSILEVLAGARLSTGQTVMLLSGHVWPGPRNSTSYAAPKVYQLLKNLITSKSINEASLMQPAADLHEAVQSWYARRNATAHYGAFRQGDPVQQAQPWYVNALRTTTQGDPSAWQRTLRDVVRLVLDSELATVGAPFI